MFIITLNLNKAIESANTNVVFLNQAIIKGNHINIIRPKNEKFFADLKVLHLPE